jgi:hypothetical protein
VSTATVDLINRTRTLLRDWATQDTLTVSLSSFGTTATVAASAAYQVGWRFQVDQEAIQVASLASSTTLTVVRAAAGTTAAAHNASAGILIRPAFFDLEILDSLNVGIDACYPTLFKEVLDTSLTVADAMTFEYSIPVTLPYLSSIEVKSPGWFAWSKTNSFEIRRGSSPVVKFHSLPAPGAAVRLRGFGPFPHLTISGSLDSQWPATGDQLPVLYAGSQLLASGEAGRARFDAGARDDREAANRAGSSTAAGRDLMGRFGALLQQVQGPPLPPHAVSIF